MWPPWAAVRPPAATGRPRRVPTASCGPPLQACPRLRPLVRADDAVPVEVETVEVGSSASPFGAAQTVVTVAVESPEALLVAGRGAGVPDVHGLVAVLDRSDVAVGVAVQTVEAGAGAPALGPVQAAVPVDVQLAEPLLDGIAAQDVRGQELAPAQAPVLVAVDAVEAGLVERPLGEGHIAVPVAVQQVEALDVRVFVLGLFR